MDLLHMLRHKHIGPTRWHHKEDDEDVEHDEHSDAKRDLNEKMHFE